MGTLGAEALLISKPPWLAAKRKRRRRRDLGNKWPFLTARANVTVTRVGGGGDTMGLRLRQHGHWGEC